MGVCWSDPEPQPPAKQNPVTVVPSAPVYQPPYQQQYPQYSQYAQPYTPQYPYAMKPQEQMVYYQYPQQQQYFQQQMVQQRQQQMNPTTAFVGGLVLGAVAEDIFDPTE